MLGRLALRRGGDAIDDPYTWWDSLSKEAIDYWQAYWRVEPFGAEWDQVAVLASTVDTVRAATFNPHVHKSDRIKKLRPITDYMPAGAYDFPMQASAPDDKKLAEKLDAFAGIKR